MTYKTSKQSSFVIKQSGDYISAPFASSADIKRVPKIS